jgi:hypothetical protein
MSDDKRIMNHPESRRAGTPGGNQHPAGTSAKEAHRVETMEAAADKKALGAAGRKAGYGKGNTRPEGQEH